VIIIINMYFVTLAKDKAEQDQVYVNFYTGIFRSALPEGQNLPKDFEEKFTKLIKGQDYFGSLEYLLEFSDQIVTLPVSLKSSECTFYRFILYLLPFFKELEADKQRYNDVKTLLSKYMQLIVNSDYQLAVKVNSLVHVFGIFSNDNGFKALVFAQLCQLCQKENSLSIIVERARNVEKEAQEWTLTLQEK